MEVSVGLWQSVQIELGEWLEGLVEHLDEAVGTPRHQLEQLSLLVLRQQHHPHRGHCTLLHIDHAGDGSLSTPHHPQLTIGHAHHKLVTSFFGEWQGGAAQHINLLHVRSVGTCSRGQHTPTLCHCGSSGHPHYRRFEL